MSMRNNEVIRGSVAVINNGQYLLSERKINVARMAAINALEFGQSSVDVDILGNTLDIITQQSTNVNAGGAVNIIGASITGNSKAALNLIAATTMSLKSTNAMSMDASEINATATGNINLNAGSGAYIFLNGDKVRFKASSYGTGDPPTSSPQTGQVYFKLIS